MGGGGHASVLIDILLRQKREIMAVICPQSVAERLVYNGIRHIKNDEELTSFSCDDVRLVNGIGFTPWSKLRASISTYGRNLGFRFETVIDDSAYVSPFAEIGEGAQILTNAVVQTGTTVGEDSIVNTAAVIEHDCFIGPNNHIAPNATLCGEVVTGSNVFIGAGATVLPHIKLSQDCLVGAGMVIKKDMA